MPTYCDECEAVIDRDEELTRIEGNDYCLDCAPTERTEMTATPKPDPKVGRVHIELAAPNDINGNPQRLSILIDPEDGVVATVDHGYEGSPRAWGSPATRITVSADEYSDWIEDVAHAQIDAD